MKASPAKGAQLPYNRWTRHVAENGLEYLAHPDTGEVKWLWSRHRDPKTGKDYLVNTITSTRQWVNPSNEHLCPVRLDITGEKSTSDNKQATSAGIAPSPSAQNRPPQSSAPGNAAAAVAASAAARRNQAQQYVEVHAPKSLGLGTDEVLMEMRGTGRRYIFNKRTKKSRWLVGQGNDVKPSFGVGSNSAQTASAHPDGGVNSYPARARTSAMPTPPPRLATEQAVADANNVEAQGPSEGGVEGSVQEKMKMLNNLIETVDAMTTAGKYAIKPLSETVEQVEKSGGIAGGIAEEATSASQRLLELNEYLMQQTLKVDGVESLGDARVRKRRKETVDKILQLIKQTEELRRRLREA